MIDKDFISHYCACLRVSFRVCCRQSFQISQVFYVSKLATKSHPIALAFSLLCGTATDQYPEDDLDYLSDQIRNLQVMMYRTCDFVFPQMQWRNFAVSTLTLCLN